MMLLQSTLAAFLDETASSSPAPGGGSVSALCGSLSMALTSMVCRLTIGKKKYASAEQEMQDTLRRAEEVRARCAAIIDEDTVAFRRVMDAFGMPKESDEEKEARAGAIETATRGATEVPLGLLRVCADAVPLVEAVAARGNVNSRSDAGVAALLLSTAAQGAAMNVLINLPGLRDRAFADGVAEEAKRLEGSVREASERIARGVVEALGT